MNQHMTCSHYWVSTKLERYVQCIHCGDKKEVEESVLVDVPMLPNEEYMEAT